MAKKYSLQGFEMERLATLDATPPPINAFPGITVQPAQTISANWGFLNSGPSAP